MMKKIFVIAILFCSLGLSKQSNAQRIEEACNIIATSIVDEQYKEFTIDGSAYLSYIWTDHKDSETTMQVDLTQVTISKDITRTGYKVWLNCLDGVNCIIEKGKLGNDENYYSEFPRTYLPAKTESDMDAIFYQLEYLLKLGNEIR
jgi:hypothetical protein